MMNKHYLHKYIVISYYLGYSKHGYNTTSQKISINYNNLGKR